MLRYHFLIDTCFRIHWNYLKFNPPAPSWKKRWKPQWTLVLMIGPLVPPGMIVCFDDWSIGNSRYDCLLWWLVYWYLQVWLFTLTTGLLVPPGMIVCLMIDPLVPPVIIVCFDDWSIGTSRYECLPWWLVYWYLQVWLFALMSDPSVPQGTVVCFDDWSIGTSSYDCLLWSLVHFYLKVCLFALMIGLLVPPMFIFCRWKCSFCVLTLSFFALIIWWCRINGIVNSLMSSKMCSIT